MITTLAPRLTEAERDAFWRDGFLHRRDVFDAATLKTLRTDLDEVSGWAAALRGSDQTVFGQEPWLDAEKPAGAYFTPVERLHDQSAAWAAVCRGVLHEHASQLLGVPGVFEHALGIIKPPIKGLTFPLHQDGVYYSPADGRCVLANVYLDDVTLDNGSILFAPGSHRQLWAHDTTRGKKSVSHPEQFQTLVTPQAQAGDVVYFHLWTVHGSPPNRSARCRRTVRVGYMT